MNVRQTRLMLGLFFLVIGLALLGLLMFMPEAARKINTPTRLGLGAFLALVLGGWTSARWYASRMAFQQAATPVREPFQPNRLGRRDEEPNPDFDFSKPKNTDDKPANNV